MPARRHADEGGKGPMTCQEFLVRFSEYYDERLEIPEEEAFDGHLRKCASCRRYVSVVERGTGLLRSLPDPEVPSDFRPRLQHRLYHVDDSRALSRGAGTSATTAVTALAMAVLLGLAAWTPTLMDGGPEVVRLPAIEVTRPARPATFFPRSSAAALFSVEMERRASTADSFGPLWDRPNDVLYRYSPLSGRHGEPRLVRTGFD